MAGSDRPFKGACVYRDRGCSFLFNFGHKLQWYKYKELSMTWVQGSVESAQVRQYLSDCWARLKDADMRGVELESWMPVDASEGRRVLGRKADRVSGT